MDGGGGCVMVTGVIAQGLRKSYKLETSWSPVCSRRRLLASSVHPNDTHPYIKLNHEPKNLNPNSYQVVAHFIWGREGDPYPTRTY